MNAYDTYVRFMIDFKLSNNPFVVEKTIITALV